MSYATRGVRYAPLLLVLVATTLTAQDSSDIARERADYLAWLTSAVNSPLAAVAQQSVGAGVRLGPADADIPLAGTAEHRVFPGRRGLMLQTPSGNRPLIRGRPVRLGSYSLFLTDSPAGTVITVFGAASGKRAPGHYPVDPSLVFIRPLIPPETHGNVRILAATGVEIEATEAGSILVPLGGRSRLRVLRVPTEGGEEAELEIFFRDQSNGHGTYPAGRFVSLIPTNDGQYRLDFNRARNPFCAYNSVYPCPAPWRGNTIAAPVHAGERYDGADLKTLPSDPGK